MLWPHHDWPQHSGVASLETYLQIIPVSSHQTPDGTSDRVTLLLFWLGDPEDSIWNKFEEEDEKWEGDNSGLL